MSPTTSLTKPTNERSTPVNDDGHTLTRNENHTTNRLLWIGVGVVVGVMLLKQIPQARRYLRLESM